MSWRKYRLAAGAVVLVVLGVTATWVARSSTRETNLTKQDYSKAVPEIKADKIDGLEIRLPDAEPIEVAKENGAWRVIRPLKAEGDPDTIEGALGELEDLEITGLAATNTKHHEELQVAEGNGIHVLPKQGGKALVHLVMGATRDGSTMVRVQGEDRVLSASGSFRYMFDKELRRWREEQVIDVEPADVKEVSFSSNNGTFRFTRNADDKWELAEGDPEPEKVASDEVDSIVSSLARLDADDFAAQGTTAEQAGLGEDAATAELVVEKKREGSGPAAKADGGTAEQVAQDAGTAEDRAAQDAGAASAGADAGTKDAITRETIVLRVGKKSDEKKDENYVYAQRQGRDVVYLLSKRKADKARPGPDAFKPSEKDEGKGPAKAKMPGGMGGKGKKLPPSVMKKIKRQMKQKRMMKKMAR